MGTPSPIKHSRLQFTIIYYYKKKDPTEKTEQIKSQCTNYSQQWWQTGNTGGSLTP